MFAKMNAMSFPTHIGLLKHSDEFGLPQIASPTVAPKRQNAPIQRVLRMNFAPAPPPGMDAYV